MSLLGRLVHGRCRIEGCSRWPDNAFVDLCPEHYDEELVRAGLELAAEQFESEVAVQLEALRRAHAEGLL